MGLVAGAEQGTRDIGEDDVGHRVLGKDRDRGVERITIGVVVRQAAVVSVRAGQVRVLSVVDGALAEEIREGGTEDVPTFGAIFFATVLVESAHDVAAGHVGTPVFGGVHRVPGIGIAEAEERGRGARAVPAAGSGIRVRTIADDRVAGIATLRRGTGGGSLERLLDLDPLDDVEVVELACGGEQLLAVEGIVELDQHHRCEVGLDPVAAGASSRASGRADAWCRRTGRPSSRPRRDRVR